MTGRYNYRTGVVDTYLGRQRWISPEEITVAEALPAKRRLRDGNLWEVALG